MSRFFSFLAGVLIGALVGSVLALLYAPSSGEALRAEMQSRLDRAVSDIKTSVETERKRLEEELAALKKGEIRVA